MKTKLCVIDLASVVDSAHGHDSIRYPTDQKLLLGVKDSIDRYRADGWHLAIVSNQDGCDIHAVKATQVRVSDYVDHGDDRYRVVEAKSLGDGVVFVYDRERPNGKDYSFYYPGSELLIHRKTIEAAIEEVQFAADLCEIEEAYFCPDIAGEVMYSLGNGVDYGWRSMVVSAQDFEDMTDLAFQEYRLPGAGMLLYAKSLHIWNLKRCLMIGNQNSIQAAAKAGFKFMTVQEFCNGNP